MLLVIGVQVQSSYVGWECPYQVHVGRLVCLPGWPMQGWLKPSSLAQFHA